MLDGQQRITSFGRFVTGKFADLQVRRNGRGPCYVAEGASSLSALGKTIAHFPVSAMFWTAVVALLSCITGRKIK